MNILFVIDQFDCTNNGITVSADRYAKHLKKIGHNVRVVTTGEPAEDLYIVPEKHVPIVTYFAHLQGQLFAKPQKDVLYKAIDWCDVVHFVMPWALSKQGVKIAKKLNKPYTSAFHVQGENVTYNMGLGKSKPAVDFIYFLFRSRFYKHIDHIHCPSDFIASELREHYYKGELHVISNGINSMFFPLKGEKPEEIKDKIVITMVGRHSIEKRQNILINAIYKSKYRDKIQLIFAGKGPKTKYYKKLSKKLPIQPIFGFYEQKELVKILQYSDLYVHPAEVEIEAISCLEALACGLVPIISDSSASATKQFALTEKSLFENGNSQNLADKIDYWIENPEEKAVFSEKYAEFAQEFKIENCIKKFEKMLQKAIDEKNAK